MKVTDYKIMRRKIDQAIGSIAMSGVIVSRQLKADMLLIATGKKNAAEVKRQIVDQYKQ